MSWLPWIDEIFSDNRPRAWHSRGVWHRIAASARHELAFLHPTRLQTLELAGLLHDLGRAIDPLDIEPHSFVGARFLDSVGLVDVAPLVAHHAGARLEAEARGVEHLDQWPQVDAELLALLDYADRTVSPSGESVSLSERRADMVARHGEGSLSVARFDAVLPHVQAVSHRFSRSHRAAVHAVVG
jgi:hypothetical protein